MLSRLKKLTTLRLAAMLLAIGGGIVAATPSRASEYSAQEIVDSGHRFFGATSGGLASAESGAARPKIAHRIVATRSVGKSKRS